jgi:GTP cyclohydrolase IV
MTENATITPLDDVQARRPGLAISLSRVGVTGVEKVIRMRTLKGEQLFSAQFECVIELDRTQKGAHMSRFEEVVNESIGEVVLGQAAFTVEGLAERIAELV